MNPFTAFAAGAAFAAVAMLATAPSCPYQCETDAECVAQCIAEGGDPAECEAFMNDELGPAPGSNAWERMQGPAYAWERDA